jgi:hypothetical protein
MAQAELGNTILKLDSRRFVKNNRGKSEVPGKKAKSNEQFVADVIRVHGDALAPIEPYIASASKIRFRCVLGSSSLAGNTC